MLKVLNIGSQGIGDRYQAYMRWEFCAGKPVRIAGAVEIFMMHGYDIQNNRVISMFTDLL